MCVQYVQTVLNRVINVTLAFKATNLSTYPRIPPSPPTLKVTAMIRFQITHDR